MWYFDRNPVPNVISWTAAISGLVNNSLNFEALGLFSRMLRGSEIKPNSLTFTSVAKACGELGEFRFGMGVVGLVIRSGFEYHLSVSNVLITLFVKMGQMDLARRVFDDMETRDVVSWTAILDMYVEMGDLKEARRVFDEMPERNNITWSALISRYGQGGCVEEALGLFVDMIRAGIMPTVSCVSGLLSSLAEFQALQPGISIHGHVIKIGFGRNVFVRSSLVDMYSKCGKMKDGRFVFDSIADKNVVLWNSVVNGYCLNGYWEEAEELFRKMPEKNTESWNCMISGHVEYKEYEKALELFFEMLLSGATPSKFTFSSVICACATLASLERGKNLHAKAIKLQAQHDVFVGTALADMYAKSGDLESSRRIFHRMPEKNEISWAVMIQGLAENGFAEQSISLFEEMLRTSFIVPNGLMLLAVLFACSHCGLVDKGLFYFNSMESVYGIKPNGNHYTCIVDLLSRLGLLPEAEEFIRSMPFKPEANAWAALLSGCKTYKNEKMAERTARELLKFTGKNSVGCVLLSNIYASAGKWLDVLNVRNLMKEMGLKKSGGCSWLEVRNHIYSFYSDDAHLQAGEMHEILQLLRFEMLV